MLALLASDPVLRTALLGCGAATLLCWVVSVVSGNYSQVDRLWSILPPLYVIGYAASARFADVRLDVMAILVTAWGARLTYNFARKGGYRRGHEDYRWPILRQKMSPLLFQLFNATFIAPYQNLLLFLIALPAWAALRAAAPLGVLDLVATLAFVAFLIGETIADGQQWRFHLDKHARQARGERIERPFFDEGLFRYSRHPNFFCEIALWWCVAAFAISAGASWLQSLLGAALLTLLFQGSTTMTERVTRAKYEGYAAYQRRTSRLLPLPPQSESRH